MSEKLHERVGGLLGVFLEDPMAGVFKHDDSHIRGDQLHLLPQEFSQGLFAADRQDRHLVWESWAKSFAACGNETK